MRRVELDLLEELQHRSCTVSELADRLDKNQGWISEVVKELSEVNLVEKNQSIKYADTFEARLLGQLFRKYDARQLLSGKKEEILRSLHQQPKTVSELEKQGFPASTAYTALSDLQTVGAVEKVEDDSYRIADQTLEDFLTASTSSDTGNVYEADGEQIVVTDGGEDVEGVLTGFSAFQRYGIDYYPVKQQFYPGNQEPGIENVLIHAVKTADNRKQASMTAIFYLKHRSILESSKLWKLANKWGCVEEWADTLAYSDQRDPKREDRFLPRDEFTSLAQDYDVFLRGHHPEKSLRNGLRELGESLDKSVDAYLLGGGNLILRELKDSTKDLDIVVDSEQDFQSLSEALRSIGYSERSDLEDAYEELDPAVVFEKEGSPRYDIFLQAVAGKLELTESMKQRVDRSFNYGNLELHLISLSDIFLFKSITEREGDLEDAALIIRQTGIKWDDLLEETKRQDSLTGQLFSFAVLDTIDILKQRESIDPPIHQKLISYCLEKALLVYLEQPKTIEDLRKELDFPDHQIYNKLRKLEDEDLIEVNRTGHLNRYQASTDQKI
ncbi:MAG: transcriptional regulator [Candidatus Nanohaloarchaea archaeon]